VTALAHERFGAGEPIALVHGANQSARSWQRVAAELATTHEVIAVDLPYSGRSADVAVDDVPALGALLGETVGRATYVGYFVGGRGAIELALAQPELVERLVLIGSVAGVRDEERARRREELLAVIAALEDDDEAAAARYFDEALEDRLQRDDFHFDAEAMAIERAANRENTPRNIAQLHRHLGMDAPGYHDRLGGLGMPVLVVAGGLAPPYVALAREVTALIGANATLAVMEGAGHPCPFERPADFAALVRAWMAETGPQVSAPRGGVPSR
jgi:2-succinyl-6-hydroxy-2,4-cyclohexadiene-1-carboxylate synthase